MANAADYGEWKTGRRITGLSFSGNLFMLKLGMAFAGALVGFSLGWFGYQAGSAVQTPLATTGDHLNANACAFCLLFSALAFISLL
ncbi:membrane transport protein [Salmonella bongori]|nr:membrane transport protein [Salmonella bongori]